MKSDAIFLQAAIEQAKKSLREGGIPIGAALVVDDVPVGLGHNRRVQQRDPILHAEMDCIRNAGRLSPDQYRRATLYTTLSPCPMCSGTTMLYGIPRVVIGENSNYLGAEDWLMQNGVQLIVVGNREIREILSNFIAEQHELWCEDIGQLES